MAGQSSHAAIFKALGHPRRLRILQMLSDNPANGRSLVTLRHNSRIPESSLLHHLRELQLAGLIQRKRNGPEVAIHLTPSGLPPSLSYVSSLARRSVRLVSAS